MKPSNLIPLPKKLINQKGIQEEAERYAKSVSKNETYQKYLREAFMAGYLASKNL